MKTALITGITGQDGAYLARFLLKKEYKVYGLYRRSSSPNFWRLLALGIKEKVELIPGDMTDMASLSNAIIRTKPDEIYNLAAQSFVGTSFEQPILTAMVDGVGVLMLLEAVKQHNPKIRVYHASTSELYGNCRGKCTGLNDHMLNEHDIFWPNSPYASSKLYSYHQVRIYREAYGMFTVNGILFNHESPLRGLQFVTRKVTNAVARIKLGLQKNIDLGHMEAIRDWGYAPEYVEAMWLMLQQPEPDDYVIATGEKHSVQELVEVACRSVGLDPRDVVVQNEKYFRPLDVNCLIGDPTHAKQKLKWEPRTKFDQLITIMAQEDYARWQNHLAGKTFPWDALNDPEAY